MYLTQKRLENKRFSVSNPAPKGQLISKGNLGVDQFFKKNAFKNGNFWPSLLWQKIFVLILEELKTQNFSSEIIWPLNK